MTEHELDTLVEAQRGPVLGGDRERVGRDVRRHDLRARMLAREGERDRAGAGPDVEDEGLRLVLQMPNGALDDHLRLGPRHEDAGIDAQRQLAEAPLAEDVRDRLARRAPVDQLPVAALLLAAQGAVRVRKELRSRRGERVRQQELGVDAGRLATRVGEHPAAVLQRLADRHADGRLRPRPLRGHAGAPRR